MNALNRRTSLGFSLVETIIALIIFLIALLALVQIPALYSKLMSLSVEKENATLHAIHVLDHIETMEYETIRESIDLTDFATSLDIPVEYTISSLIVDPDEQNPSSKTITITISSASGLARKDVSLTRVVSPFADKTAE